jgi:hypothetical protein
MTRPKLLAFPEIIVLWMMALAAMAFVLQSFSANCFATTFSGSLLYLFGSTGTNWLGDGGIVAGVQAMLLARNAKANRRGIVTMIIAININNFFHIAQGRDGKQGSARELSNRAW